MHFSYEGQVRTLPPDPENANNDPLLDAMEMDPPSLMEMDPPSPGGPFSQSLLARL